MVGYARQKTWRLPCNDAVAMTLIARWGGTAFFDDR